MKSVMLMDYTQKKCYLLLQHKIVERTLNKKEMRQTLNNMLELALARQHKKYSTLS